MRRIGSQCFKETVEFYKGYLQRRACRLEYPNSNVSEISNINDINELLAPEPTEVWLKRVGNQTTGILYLYHLYNTEINIASQNLGIICFKL